MASTKKKDGLDFLNQARTLCASHRWTEALELINILLAGNPLAVNLYLLRSRVIQLLEIPPFDYTLEDALADVEMALKIDPDNLEAKIELYYLSDAVITDQEKSANLKIQILDRIAEIKEDISKT